MTSTGARSLAHDTTRGDGATRSSGVSTPVLAGVSARADTLRVKRAPHKASSGRTRITAASQKHAHSCTLAPPGSGPTRAVIAASCRAGARKYQVAPAALAAPKPAAPAMAA